MKLAMREEYVAMKPSRYIWFVAALLWLVWLLNYLDRQVIFSLFPVLRTGGKVTVRL